jgi:hypothetical protein
VAAIAAVVLWITGLDFTRYLGLQAYVLTDAPYAAAVVLVLWCLHRALDNGGWWILGTGAALVVAASLRPNGWLLVPVVVGYLTATRWREWWGWALTAALLVLAVFSAQAVPGAQGVRGDVVDQLAAGQIFPAGMGYDHWQLTMPARSGDQGALAYVATHPLATARLALTRVATEASHIRPTYSTQRNVVFGAWAAIVWGLAALGTWSFRRTSFIWLAVSIVVVQMGLVAVTFADADGRWLVHVAGPLCLLAALGVARLTQVVVQAPPS